MRFIPIQKKQKIYQTIIQQIKTAITDGSIQPGDKLPSERALAEMLSVSRTSVKEAVTVLESSGIITVRSGVGMFLNADSKNNLLYKFSKIIEETKSDFIDLIELRQAIEGDAAFYAASRMTLEQKNRITDIYQRLLEIEQEGNIAIEEDYQFHYTIVESANNPVMLEVINLVADKIKIHLRESREHSIKEEALNNQVMKEHENIFTAIVNKQPEIARQAMWEHHQGIKQRHMQLLLSRDGGIQ